MRPEQHLEEVAVLLVVPHREGVALVKAVDVCVEPLQREAGKGTHRRHAHHRLQNLRPHLSRNVKRNRRIGCLERVVLPRIEKERHREERVCAAEVRGEQREDHLTIVPRRTLRGTVLKRGELLRHPPAPEGLNGSGNNLSRPHKDIIHVGCPIPGGPVWRTDRGAELLLVGRIPLEQGAGDHPYHPLTLLGFLKEGCTALKELVGGVGCEEGLVGVAQRMWVCGSAGTVSAARMAALREGETLHSAFGGKNGVGEGASSILKEC